MTEDQKAKHAAYMREYRIKNKERVRLWEKRSYEKNRERLAARQKLYYQKNREQILCKQREYSAVNSKKIVERVMDWQAANPDRTRAIKIKSSRKLYAANPKKFREVARRHAKANPAKRAATQAIRRAKKLAAMPEWVDKDALGAIYAESRRCGLTVDHIIPLNHPLVCGLHVPWNLQLLTNSENASKGNRFTP